MTTLTACSCRLPGGAWAHLPEAVTVPGVDNPAVRYPALVQAAAGALRRTLAEGARVYPGGDWYKRATAAEHLEHAKDHAIEAQSECPRIEDRLRAIDHAICRLAMARVLVREAAIIPRTHVCNAKLEGR